MLDNINAHIISPHEDTNMKLCDFIKMCDDLLCGNVDYVQEKLDGQNITFTVINGKLQFFNKGLTPTRVSRAISGENPGNMLYDMQRYGDKSISDTFMNVYKALDKVFYNNTGITEKVFQNGKFVIEASIMGPLNKNTISYEKTYFRLIQFVSMFGDNPDYNAVSYLKERLFDSADLDIHDVPILKYIKNKPKYNIYSDVYNIATNHGLTLSNTIGDLYQELTCAYLERNTCIPIGLVKSAAQRLVTGDKKILKHTMFESNNDWKLFQDIEKRNTFLYAAIVPFEEILQRAASDIFNCYEFQLSDTVNNAPKKIKENIALIINSIDNKKIDAPQLVLDRINDTAKRLTQVNLYQKDVEGIVFQYNNKQYKFVGIFSPINKILGYFHYGQASIQR